MSTDTLAVLRDARALIADDATGGEFAFNDWTRCTCGYVYRAATGVWADDRSQVNLARHASPYESAIDDLARALGRSAGLFAPLSVSNATTREAGLSALVTRADALAVLDRAIEVLEGRAQPAAFLSDDAFRGGVSDDAFRAAVDQFVRLRVVQVEAAVPEPAERRRELVPA